MNLTVRHPFASAALLAALLCVAAGPGAADKQKQHRVTIRDLKYEPATIKIKIGDSIRWINKDDHDHTVVATNKSFASGNLGRNTSFQHVFTKAGKFDYYCRYHPRMKGTVTVEN